MKKILFLLLLPITCFAQGEISNFWKSGTRGISAVINDKSDSYWISRDPIVGSRYGRSLNLNDDGKIDREPRDLGIFEIKAYENRYNLIKINNK